MPTGSKPHAPDEENHRRGTKERINSHIKRRLG